MFSCGNSLGSGQSIGECQTGLLKGERRNTEPFYARLWRSVQDRGSI
jgi:hypothetical protein